MSHEKICGVMPSDILCVSDDEPILASKLIEEIEKGNLKWDESTTISENASSMGGSQIFLETG